MTGGKRCRMHGGSAPQTKRAAQLRVAESRAVAALQREGVPAVRDPLGALQQLAGECVGLKDMLADRVAELQSWRYESRQGQEQLRSEITLLERALDRCGRVLTDLARLGLDARVVAVTERQGELLAGAIERALAACGLSDDTRLRGALASELRLLEAG